MSPGGVENPPCLSCGLWLIEPTDCDTSDNFCSCVCCICQPLQQWTVTNGVEWMAGLNLYRYVEVFKAHNINGEQLVTLDEDKLKVRIILSTWPDLL